MIKRWMFRLATAMGAGALALSAGCGLLSLLSSNQVTVSLVNQSDFPVDVDILIGDEQEMPEFLLRELRNELDFALPAGGAQTFSRPCSELQAIMIEDADLRALGGLGPDASTDVQRDGDDFSCGDTITFTFSHSVIITDFRVNVTVQSGGFGF